MGFYRDRLLPRFENRSLDDERIHQLRARVCVGLRGEMVEVGFGYGLNVRHYPTAINHVHAIEPSRGDDQSRPKRTAVSTTRNGSPRAPTASGSVGVVPCRSGAIIPAWR